MKTAYLQCVGGVSGDMLLGALVDVGVPLDDISAVIERLGVEGVSLSARKEQRGGVPGTHVKVNLNESQASLTIADFVRITRDSGLPTAVTEPACKVFERLGEAEAKVHGTQHREETPLHELGTLDTLVDVVGAVAALDMLQVKNLTCSPLPSGSGVFQSAHGKLVAPSPATAARFKTGSTYPPINSGGRGV